MTNEDKQVHIDAANKWIELMQRYIENHPQDIGAPITLGLYEIALAALTAQPVAWLVEFHEPMTDDYCREVKTVKLEKPTGHYMACATPLIRAAGYEVRE